MTHRLIELAADLIWPSLDGNPSQHEARESRKIAEEERAIGAAVASLPSIEDELKDHLAASEKLLDSEHSRKGGIESRLLNAAGLVSIAGTVVLGALFSLASEKLTLSSAWARTILTFGCFYLALQLVAALHAAVKGLRAVGYIEDQPHELLPRYGLKRTVYLRERIEHLLVRVADHRRVNNGKLDQLNIAHSAMRNFLWGLLSVAFVASVVSVVWPPPLPAASCPAIENCRQNAEQVSVSRYDASPFAETSGTASQDVGLPVILISCGIGIATLGLALIAAGGTTARRVVGVMMATGGFGLSVLGSGKLESTIFRIEKLIGELHLELSLGSKLQTQQTFIRRVVTVGPFPDGDHLMSDQRVAKCISSALDQYRGMRIGGWEIVGRVDKRQLKMGRAGIYGSNQALAMSRASWVTNRFLTSQPSFDLTHAIITVGGAQGIGPSVNVNDLQSDRAVDVFAVVNANKEAKGTISLPEPIVCPPRVVPGK